MNDIPDFVRANAAKLWDSILATEKETEVAKPAMAAAKPLSVPPNVVTPGIAAETGAGLKTLGTARKVFEFLGVAFPFPE